MPKKPTKGMLAVYLELPPDLLARFDDLAEQMGRTRKAELILAMERHLAYPPKPPQPVPQLLDPFSNEPMPAQAPIPDSDQHEQTAQKPSRKPRGKKRQTEEGGQP